MSGNTQGGIERFADAAEHLTLRSAPVNRATISARASQQSIRAIEEYHSARGPSAGSRPASSGSYGELQPLTNIPISTVPAGPGSSQHHTHSMIHPHGQSGVATFLPSTQAAMARLQEGAREGRPGAVFRLSDDGTSQIRRKPVGSGGNRNSDSSPIVCQLVPAGPPSPEMDDSPYIRFALDQLTRDEEVRGSRQYRYPGEGRVAILELSAEGEISQRAEAVRSPLLPRPPIQEQPGRARAQSDSSVAAAPQPGPQDDMVPVVVSGNHQPDVFVPFDQEVPSLRFVPGILRWYWLTIFFFLCLLMLTAVLLSGIWSNMRGGLYPYTRLGGSRYFVFEYLPTICGMVLLLWLFQIQIALQRIAPFIAMASYSSKCRTEGPLMGMQPTNFIFPKLFYFRAGQPVLGVCMFIFWLQIFTIPLLGSLYNVYFYGNPASGQWRWVTVLGVAWTLAVLYFLLCGAILALGVWLRGRRTGLRWDPRSLADLVALLDRSNIIRDYAGSEIFVSVAEFRERLAMRSDRLGYWHTSRNPNEIFYGIGEEGAPTRRYSLEAGKIREKDPLDRGGFPLAGATTLLKTHDLESNEEYDHVRYRYLPWYLRPSLVLLWCVAAILLYLTFLIASFVNRAVLDGFSPLTPVSPNSAGFSATNFLYSFVPSVIAEIMLLCWLSIDFAFRRLQPYAAMSSSSGNGASAQQSLFLDYAALLPFSVTLAALTARDIRIAWFSLLSLIAATLPILAGGCFWAQFYIAQQEVRVAVEPSGYYALCVFLAVYAFSLPFIFFGLSQRSLPHRCTNLAEQISWLYQSRVLGEREWRAPMGSKTETTTKLVTATTQLEKEFGEARFAFGRFTGRDGMTHLGVERIGRGEHRMTERGWRRDKKESSDVDDGLTRRTGLSTARRSRSGRSALLQEVQTRRYEVVQPDEDVTGQYEGASVPRYHRTTAGPEYIETAYHPLGGTTSTRNPYPERQPASSFERTPFLDEVEHRLNASAH